MVKVAVRPLKGQQFEVDIEPELTVEDLKKKIAETNAEFPADLQKLIHSGKILQDATKVQDTGIKEGEFVVVMLTKAKAPGGGASSTPAPAQQAPAAPAPAPAAEGTAPASGPPASDAPTSYDTAASNLVTGGAMESTIQQLCDMGYPRAEVERCLQAAFNNPDRAVEYLISGIPEGIQAPPAGAPTPAAAAAPGTAPPPGAAPGGGAAAFPAMPTGGGAGGGNPASLAVLQELRNNPRFMQLAQMVTANPQALAQMLSALHQSHPEIARTIAENPEAFMQMLAQASGGGQEDPVSAMLAAGGGGGGGGPGGAPGQTVRLTEEERAAVGRLEALGFDRNMAIQAYLACDKNEEMAANFLFDNGD
uniref:UV excision repair protein RAD23 n=1 Tax=Alexandrium monilatum TaxID=311494 RepID=A0A7S4S2J1_9DINO